MKSCSIKILIVFSVFAKLVFANDLNSVQIISDEVEWNEKEKIAYARGNASAEQGGKKITADELIVFLSKDEDSAINNEIILIEAIGNVAFYSLGDKATGDSAKYSLLENKIIFIGNVTLKRNENIMHGERLELNLNTGVSSISKGKKGEKVRMLFSTKSDKGKNKNDEQ